MANVPKVSVAVVGLGFGEAFLPIYLSHPNVDEVAIVEPDAGRRTSVGDRYGIGKRYDSLEAALSADAADAYHILSPVAFHASQAIEVLRARRHCACAVPMATSLEDIYRLVDVAAKSHRTYMMMETSAYCREFLEARSLFREGRLGRVTFYRGYHMQDLDGFPGYWRGYPPMHYITHALSPVLALLETTVTSVACLGSGRLSDDRRGRYENDFPLETGIFQLAGVDSVAEITMSFFQTARSYIEGFSLYGEKMGIEWPVSNDGPLRIFEMLPVPEGGRGRPAREQELVPRDSGHLLPPDVGRFTQRVDFVPAPGAPAVTVSPGHGGSHPHLVHEFIRSIVEERPAAINPQVAAAWTAPGIVAHESAMEGGVWKDVPAFR